MESNNKDLWVAERLEAIEPQWQADVTRGSALLHLHIEKRQRPLHWMVAAAATAALGVVISVFPESRGFAQDLWHRMFLNRVEAVRVDLSKIPLDVHVTTNGAMESFRNVEEAERKAGFQVYLPPSSIIGTVPEFVVTGPIAVGQTIHVHDIESALAKIGETGVEVSAQWEGVQLRANIGPLAGANYPNNVEVLQTTPIEFIVPTNFPLERFAEVAFRSAGVPAWEARSIAAKFAAHPAWLLDVPAKEVANIQELTLAGGPALLVEEFDAKGAVKQATVIRTTNSRIYCVSSGTRDLSVKIANSLP